MANCHECVRSKLKRENHLAADGYIECKATNDASMLMQAFHTFSAERRCQIPFVVIGDAEHPSSAWPFQFQPQSIIRCDGFLKIDT